MIALIQRVSHSTCHVNGQVYSEINKGLLVLLGIETADNSADVEWLSNKIINLRIFSDEEGKMNLSINDIDGEIMIISQFTLHASTKKGNRPSFINAARPEQAIPLYEEMIRKIKSSGIDVKSGEFGADMKIELINDGPVTIHIDSQNRI